MLSSSVTEARCRDSIPVIDFDILVNGTADQRLQAIRDLGRACEDWGVFMVVNHGVPETLQQAMMEACKEFLSSPDEEKVQYMEAGPMDPIRIGTGYYSAKGSAWLCRHYLKMQFVHPELRCPAKPETLRYLAADLATQTRDLMLQLGDAMSESLGLDTGRISDALNLESCFQMLVQNQYTKGSGLDGVGTALPPHTDHGFLALIFQNSIDGLEVWHDGQWLLAKPIPGAFMVLAGDQLEIVSNERYKAVIHRAVVSAEQARISFVSMVGPHLDAIVEPVHKLAAGGHGMEFRGIKYQDYIIAHQKSDRANGRTAMDVVRAQHDTTA